MFKNKKQSQIIAKLELLNKAMQANTRQESEKYLNLLNKL